MRLTRLVLIGALMIGVVGPIVGQEIHRTDPSWAYFEAQPGGLAITITKSGATMASIHVPAGNLVAVSDGTPVRNGRDFEGTFELRTLPLAEAKAGPAAVMMSTAPFVLRVEGAHARVERLP